jgi:hypothetical protein
MNGTVGRGLAGGDCTGTDRPTIENDREQTIFIFGTARLYASSNPSEGRR